jgi:DNA gyrase/topoisomerase IV subunit B
LSALGSLISVRDSKTIGGLPLRGKVLNVRGMKPVDILKNKEISELLSVLGLEFGKPAIAVDELFEITLDGTKYVVSTDDEINHNGKLIKVSSLL